MVRERILIIENGDDLPEQSLAILSDHHYETESAKDVHQALGRLSEQPFDLILADLSLPEMNGLQLLHRINKIH